MEEENEKCEWRTIPIYEEYKLLCESNMRAEGKELLEGRKEDEEKAEEEEEQEFFIVFKLSSLTRSILAA